MKELKKAGDIEATITVKVRDWIDVQKQRDDYAAEVQRLRKEVQELRDLQDDDVD